MGKWATELAEHVTNFVTRNAIKSQVRADFVADWTPSAPKGELKDRYGEPETGE
jgi:hypothetical protein